MKTLYDYLRRYSKELGHRIVETYPPLHALTDPPVPELARLLRKPLPAQELAIMGCVKYLADHDAVQIVGECGTGKTLMAGAGITYAASHANPYTTIVMCPPHLVEKWAQEMITTVPNCRTYIIEGLRDITRMNKDAKANPHGVVKIQYNNGVMKRRGVQTSLPKMRVMGRRAWRKEHPYPCFFIVGKEKAKLSYFWKHVYGTAPKSNKQHVGGLINIDTFQPVEKSEHGFLCQDDFDDKKQHQEIIERGMGRGKAYGDKSRTVIDFRHNSQTLYSPLWSADLKKIQRMAPMDFMGRYMKDWFDYSIADEVHQLSGDTAQGNCLGVLARLAKKVITLTGTMSSGSEYGCRLLLIRPHM